MKKNKRASIRFLLIATIPLQFLAIISLMQGDFSMFQETLNTMPMAAFTVMALLAGTASLGYDDEKGKFMTKRLLAGYFVALVPVIVVAAVSLLTWTNHIFEAGASPVFYFSLILFGFAGLMTSIIAYGD